MKQTLCLPRTLANQLLTLAQSSPNEEICGLVAQRSPQKYRVYPIENSASNKATVFEMNPEQQIQAFKSIRENNEELFAVFHSHPDSPPIPSKKDLQDAAYQDVLNIIISLSTQGVLELRGYYYSEDTAQAVELSVD